MCAAAPYWGWTGKTIRQTTESYRHTILKLEMSYIPHLCEQCHPQCMKRAKPSIGLVCLFASEDVYLV